MPVGGTTMLHEAIEAYHFNIVGTVYHVFVSTKEMVCNMLLLLTLTMIYRKEILIIQSITPHELYNCILKDDIPDLKGTCGH
jgi:hypothetical protein